LGGGGSFLPPADEVDPDVVDVMHVVSGDEEAGDVAIEDEGFTHRGLAVVDFVAVDDEIGDGRHARAIDSDAHGVGPANLVDAAVANFEMIATALDAHAGTVGDGEVVPQLETDQADVLAVQ